MAFNFQARSEAASSQTSKGEAPATTATSELRSPLDQHQQCEPFSTDTPAFWTPHSHASPDHALDLDAWNVEPSRPPSSYDPFSFHRSVGVFPERGNPDSMHAAVRRLESEPKLRRFGIGPEGDGGDPGQYGAPFSQMPAFHPNYSRARHHHQRYASASSALCGEDRYVLPSDPGSDFSSDYSDVFQPPTFAIHPQAGHREPHDEGPARPALMHAPPAPLPDFVVEELKRLKLENMALRRMANEVVRLNVGADSPDRRGDFACSHHTPLTSTSRLESVFEGANPIHVYSSGPEPRKEENPIQTKPRSGTAASMWAPGGSAQFSRNGEEVTAAANSGGTPVRPSDSVTSGIGGRFSTASPATPASPAQRPLGESAVKYETSPSTAALPAHLRAQALAKGSPSSSPGSTPRSPSKLENAPASRLVGMILDRRGQEASLLLQQQLKSGSPERRTEILEAVRPNIVALSHDRHGNFLVQGAIEVRSEMAMALKGAFVELTMSQFGCHVVQKALEGEEEVREAVTLELLGSRLDQTLTSRHSIHVWQRILESEWKRPSLREEIFASINRQLKGQWARMARQEAGSIICQNIFESAQPDEKAQCMHEVLEELEECATNQWGVWVVQHIIEHGSPDERSAALQGVVRSASKLTLSQYGQKAVMSGLKTGDRHFLHGYVDVMCQTSQPRRPPLIDVCLAAHGIQIVTQLLTTVDPRTRERIISTVRRNSVFLKGSKTGMKVHQLCERARAFAGY